MCGADNICIRQWFVLWQFLRGWNTRISSHIWHNFEPCHEIIVRFVLCKLILQTRMRSHPMRLDVWFLVGSFVYFCTSSVRTAKALARLGGCTGSPEPSLVTCVISTIISWAGSFQTGNLIQMSRISHASIKIFSLKYILLMSPILLLNLVMEINTK